MLLPSSDTFNSRENDLRNRGISDPEAVIKTSQRREDEEKKEADVKNSTGTNLTTEGLARTTLQDLMTMMMIIMITFSHGKMHSKGRGKTPSHGKTPREKHDRHRLKYKIEQFRKKDSINWK